MRTRLRLSFLTTLLLTTSAGVVMASSTACRVVVLYGMHQARAAARRHVHHSSATLARWKIGAAAWSKAHGGKTYAGVPAARHADWKPMTFTCDDVALDMSRPDENLMLAGEEPPQFAMWMGMPPGLSPLPTTLPPLQGVQEASYAGGDRLFFPAPFGGGTGAGAGNYPDAPVGPASFPPGPVPPVLAGPVPAPEPPTVMLLATGMLSFLVSKLRRRTVV